jgi:ankyrin repeat protein
MGTLRKVNNSPLALAVLRGNLEEVRRLVEEGANKDKAESKGGYTPLIFAAQTGRLPIIRYLL